MEGRVARVRAPAVLVCVALVALAWGWERPGAASVVAPSVARTAQIERIGAVAPEPAWAARSLAVKDACGLDLVAACRDGACVAVASAPDLDGLWGWARLGASSPRIVASTLLRDAGVPRDALPCGAAIESLVGGSGVITVRDGASEVWCATEGPDAAVRALCADLGHASFDDPDLRRRSF